jgi:hypothetical protein
MLVVDTQDQVLLQDIGIVASLVAHGQQMLDMEMNVNNVMLKVKLFLIKMQEVCAKVVQLLHV